MSKVAMDSNDKVDILQLNNFGNCETWDTETLRRRATRDDVVSVL